MHIDSNSNVIHKYTPNTSASQILTDSDTVKDFYKESIKKELQQETIKKESRQEARAKGRQFRQEERDQNKNVLPGSSGFDMNLLGSSMQTLSSLGSSLTPRVNNDTGFETQQAIGNALMSTGNPYAMAAGFVFNGLSSIGEATGLNSSKFNDSQAKAAGISDSDKFWNNLAAVVPMLGAAGVKTSNAEKSLEINKVSGAFSGTAADIDTAATMGGKRYLAGGNQANDFINQQNERNKILTDISLTNTLRKSSDLSQEINSQNYNRYNGNNYQYLSVGKNGMKLEELDSARNALSKKEKVRLTNISTDIKGAVSNNPMQNIISTTSNIVESAKDGKLTNKELYDIIIDQILDDTPDKLDKILYGIYDLPKETINALDIDGKEAISNIMLGNVNTSSLLTLMQSLDEISGISNLAALEKTNSMMLKNGGVVGIDSSIIPEGALHKELNHMEDHNEELDKVITDKGIAVVTTDSSGNPEQVAEIEKEEIIFSKSITEQIENLWKQWKETNDKDKIEILLLKAGKILTKEIVTNTDDNTGEMLNGDD